MKKQIVIVLIYIFYLVHIGVSQPVIDSLKVVYPTQKNSERAATLGELAYQLAYDDSRQAIIYGKMSYQAALESAEDAVIAQALNDWTIPYLVEGNFDTVVVLCNQALEIRKQLGDSVGMAKIYNKLANAQYELGRVEESLRNNLLAVGLFERNDLKGYAGRILANIAVAYENRGSFTEALDFYSRAKATAQEENNLDAYYSALIGESNCFTKMGKFQLAEVNLKEALKYYFKTENTDMIGSVYQNLGFNISLKGDKEKAFDYYKKALKKYEENNSKLGQALIFVNLGQILMDQKRYEEAEPYLQKGLKLSAESQSSYQLQHAYKALTRLKNLEGDYEGADKYFDLYDAYMDSIYNTETSFAIAEMQVKYQTDQKTQALVQEKLKRSNAQLWLVVASISIFLLLFLVLFLRHRKKLEKERLKLEALENVEAERSRIARDLHDNLGADLSLITSKIDIQAYQQNDVNFKADLEQISAISKLANSQLRDTIWSIHKPSLNLAELGDKITDFAKRVLDQKDIAFVIDCKNKHTELPPAKALHLFRISQEFINNSLKYASAATITVMISNKKLVLKDDGIGFKQDKVQRGYGLNNIDQRVKEMNATAKWEVLVPGTSLTIEF